MTKYARDEFDRVPETSTRQGVHRAVAESRRRRLAPILAVGAAALAVGLVAFLILPKLGFSTGGNTAAVSAEQGAGSAAAPRPVRPPAGIPSPAPQRGSQRDARRVRHPLRHADADCRRRQDPAGGDLQRHHHRRTGEPRWRHRLHRRLDARRARELGRRAPAALGASSTAAPRRKATPKHSASSLASRPWWTRPSSRCRWSSCWGPASSSRSGYA